MLPGVIMNRTILSQTGAGSRCGAVCERRPSSTRNALRDLFALADIRVDGERPWDLRVRNDRFYPRVLTGGTLALGESYMDGWWECEALDEMLLRAIRARLSQRLPMDLATAWAVLQNTRPNDTAARWLALPSPASSRPMPPKPAKGCRSKFDCRTIGTSRGASIAL